jgi:hypothetical protein
MCATLLLTAPGVPPSGNQISFKTADMYRISNGQLVEHWDVIEILDMLIAMGAVTFSQPPVLPSSDGNTTIGISGQSNLAIEDSQQEQSTP